MSKQNWDELLRGLKYALAPRNMGPSGCVYDQKPESLQRNVEYRFREIVLTTAAS
jgi:hypothetical protein